MTRRILIITLLVLALAVTIAGLESHARRHWDDGIWITGLETASRFRCGMIDGTFHLVLVRPSSPRAAKPSSSFSVSELRLGSFYVRSASNGQVNATGGGIPFWAIVLLFTAWPATVLIRHIARSIREVRREECRRRGECVQCGYNLHGLTEPRCPECGTPFEANAPSAAET